MKVKLDIQYYIIILLTLILSTLILAFICINIFPRIEINFTLNSGLNYLILYDLIIIFIIIVFAINQEKNNILIIKKDTIIQFINILVCIMLSIIIIAIILNSLTLELIIALMFMNVIYILLILFITYLHINIKERIK